MILRGRTALVTGATGGIGIAIARALHGEGAHLILTGRRAEILDPLGAELGARTILSDLADRAAVEDLLERAGDVDVLVANAALPASGDLAGFTIDQIDRALDVNLRAPIVLARLASEQMTARGSGHIVFISSISGKVSAAGSSLYSATKFGVRGFALGLREEMRETGIGVSTIFPGFIRDAGMFADADVELRRGIGTRAPEDVAAAVVRAIQRDIGEIDVAPASIRASARLAGAAPGFVMAVSRRLGARQLATEIAAAQRDKR